MSNREQFARTVVGLLDEREDLALVYAEISGQYFREAEMSHPDRVVNVGIREQLMVGAAAGLALAEIRPVVHTFAPFLVERAFEQIKLDLAHQGLGAVLVGTGGSYDMSALGRTHQSPGDVALMSTIPGMVVHAPSTPAETDAVLRRVIADQGLHYVRISDRQNAADRPDDSAFHVLREGAGRLAFVALGSTADAALEAAEVVDATVLSAVTVHPLDAPSLQKGVGRAEEIVVLEPWWQGTSTGAMTQALDDLPRRYLSLGTDPSELRRYGSPEEHERAQGLQGAAIARRVTAWQRVKD